ncbi:unnamed protein product [Gongylonema pulchrum]|uniref:S1 motif domain-containing protein n=1 Tax=Gongylonema pulchrum TaxID=637853 RepID=A0A183DG83_9BILA|nr:unnamed protein product [Gongylonema pulchrum]
MDGYGGTGSWPHIVWQHIDSCPGQPVGVRVRFDSGITGFIPNKYLSDRPDSFVDPGERVRRNQPVYCRILELDPDKFSATCSCRSSDLRGLQPQNSEYDRYFDRQACQVTGVSSLRKIYVFPFFDIVALLTEMHLFYRRTMKRPEN